MQKSLLIVIAICLVSIAWIDSSSNTGHGIKHGKEEIRDSAAANGWSHFFEALALGEKGMKKETFLLAMAGYKKLTSIGQLKKPLLAIVDFSQPSGKKRLYILNMAKKELLVHTLVAHGRNSGERMATHFSNKPSSLQSSLGFFVAGATYIGSNGLSLRLSGLEKGINDKAEERAIVMHGAPYVNESMAARGRIGRSWGCPAVSQKEHKQIIELLKNGSCLFIYAPNQQYLAKSTLIGSITSGSAMN